MIAAGAEAAAQSAAPVTEVEEITVSLTSRDERLLQSAPAAVSVVDEREVVRRQANTAEELLGDIPGVSLDGGSRGISQEPNIRGFQDEQVVIRLDGARQNFNFAHRGRFFVDPDILQSVEVLRGGASALYGSGAIGGVVGLRTKSAQDLLESGQSYGLRLKSGYTDNGQELLGTATAYGVYGGLDFLGFASIRERGEDFETGAGAPILNSDIDSRNLLGKVGLQANDALRFEFNAQHYRDDGVTPNAADRLVTDPATDSTLVDRDMEVQSYRLKMQYAPAGSDLTDLEATVYYTLNDLVENRVNSGDVDTTEYATIGAEVVNRSTLRSSLFAGAPVALAYGVEIYRDEQTGERESVLFDFPDASLTSIGVFAQAEIPLTARLKLTPGVRFDHFSLEPDGAFDDRSESQVSPKIAIAYEATPRHTLWGSASRSFRAPSLTELYQTGVHFSIPFVGNNVFVPTPDLRPEIADQLELGFRFSQSNLHIGGDRLSFEANAYVASVEDYIDTLVTGPTFFPVMTGGTTSNFNVDAELWGFESAFKYDAPRWYLGLSGSITRGRSTDGGALGSIPQDKLVLSLGLRPLDGVEVGARSTFRDEQNDLSPLLPDAVPTGGSTVIDLYSVYQPEWGPLRGVTLTAGVDNVGDADYAVHPVTELGQPGRTFKMTGAVKF